MSELTDLLEATGRQLEPEIQRRLHGMLGGIVRAYLPQVWEFKTDSGDATLTVDRDGHAATVEGTPEHPDVTIEIPLGTLRTALESRRKDGATGGSVRATPHTAKGRAAFDYLRGRIGL